MRLRLIWGRNYGFWEDGKNQDKEVEVANEALRIASTIGDYKDELISTLTTLLAYKDSIVEDLIESLKEERSNK